MFLFTLQAHSGSLRYIGHYGANLILPSAAYGGKRTPTRRLHIVVSSLRWETWWWARDLTLRTLWLGVAAEGGGDNGFGTKKCTTAVRTDSDEIIIIMD